MHRVVIGGIGSIRGAFVAALLVGLLDTLGRAMLPDALRLVLDASSARQTGAALASMLVYIVMAAILAVRPAGLYQADLDSQSYGCRQPVTARAMCWRSTTM